MDVRCIIGVWDQTVVAHDFHTYLPTDLDLTHHVKGVACSFK